MKEYLAQAAQGSEYLKAPSAKAQQALNANVKPVSGIDRLGESVSRLRAAVLEVSDIGDALCGPQWSHVSSENAAKLSNCHFDRMEEYASDVSELADEIRLHLQHIRSRM